jgi:hypothetical protein
MKQRKVGDQVLNFPETMTDEDINDVIRKKFPSKSTVTQNENAEEETMLEKKKSLMDMFQDFMQPKKTDAEGNVMPETLFGRLPEKPKEFKIGTPENEDILKEMIDAGSGAPGLKTVVQAPFKLSLKNIANNIIKAKKKEELFHNTQYNRLWEAAKKAGIENVKLNNPGIKAVINKMNKAKVNDKYIRPLEELMKNPTLENAQKAQSDLGKLINSPQLSKEVLVSGEDAAKKAAIKAQEHIRHMMFRDAKGNLNKDLKKTYDELTTSYEKNMVPYKNKNINKYQKGKMTEKQLIPKLKSGEFMATRGSFHPEIDRRDMILEMLKHAGVPVTSGAIGVGGGMYLMNKLLGKE